MSEFLPEANNYLDNHQFLAEELLQPMTNHCDLGRSNMFCQHFVQSVVLDQPEKPRVFSGFENKIGSYSSAVKKFKQSGKIISTFEFSPLRRAYAIRYEDGSLDLVFGECSKWLTESYGYKSYDLLKDCNTGDHVTADQAYCTWGCSDEDGNMQYGINLKTVFMCFKGLTYEDGFVISESTAEKLTHNAVEQISVVVNANDILINTYGDASLFKCFPDIGEEIKDGILTVRRRINKEALLVDLANKRLNKINYNLDRVFYADGIVTAIEIFSNSSGETLEKHEYYKQILKYYNSGACFYNWLLNIFSIPIMNNALYSDDVAFWFRRAKEVSEGFVWKHEGGEFDGFVIKFSIMRKKKCVIGSKITNRYGGKGVISKILPDDQMPITEDGERAEIVSNSLGIINRMNLSVLFEQELNFMANEIQKRIKIEVLKGEYEEGWRIHQEFLKDINPKQAEFFEETVGGLPETRDEYLDELAADEHIYICQPPMYGNITFEQFSLVYKKWKIERKKFVGISNPMVLGEIYFMKLRHEPAAKLSVRSAGSLSLTGIPNKNNRGVKNSIEHHSTTPVRLGEQELPNLLISNNPKEIQRLVRMYSTDEGSREFIIKALLTRNPFGTKTRLEPSSKTIPRPATGFQSYLNTIGLEITSTDV